MHSLLGLPLSIENEDLEEKETPVPTNRTIKVMTEKDSNVQIIPSKEMPKLWCPKYKQPMPNTVRYFWGEETKLSVKNEFALTENKYSDSEEHVSSQNLRRFWSPFYMQHYRRRMVGKWVFSSLWTYRWMKALGIAELVKAPMRELQGTTDTLIQNLAANDKYVRKCYLIGANYHRCYRIFFFLQVTQPSRTLSAL